MKMSKHDRKIFNQGRALGYSEGYSEGYAQGLHDGNPFIKMAEACQEVARRIFETMNDPEVRQMILEAKQRQDDMETLEIEGGQK